MARPQIKIDDVQLSELMRMKPTLADTAAFFKVSEDTIERSIEKRWGLTFIAFRNRNMVSCRHELIRAAMDKALKGDNQMLTLCLKHMCGWNEKERNDYEPKPIVLAYNLESLSPKSLE